MAENSTSENSTSIEALKASAGRGDKIRQLTPFISACLVAAYIALVVLPSSLNLPNSNPSTVLEYAPIPPNDQNNPPPDASSGLGSLGVASTGGLTTGLNTPLIGKPPGANYPKSLKCVSGHQTEDPNSPPCQPFFEGDNGGATYTGVSRDSINILIYFSTGITIDNNTGQTEQTPAAGTYCSVEPMDCDGDGKTDDRPHEWIRIANAYARYFNSRYQTYGRTVHFWIFWSGAGSSAGRRSDAADNFAKIRPFAVIDEAVFGGYHEDYVDSMAKRSSMVFASFIGQPRAFYQRYAPRVWSFWPDIENWSDQFVGYVCKKVVPTNVTSGDFAGQKRVYGFYYTSDDQYRPLQQFAHLVQGRLENECGVKFATTRTFPYSGWAVDSQGDRSYAATNIADFQQNNVNTIIWAGGNETDTSKAADGAQYHPEWITAGDGTIDSNSYAQVQGQDSWANAWTVSYHIRSGALQEDMSYKAYKEAEPEGQDYYYAQSFYRDWFMVFQSIQVAGPRLTPQSVDAGLHAIQRRSSSSPYLVAGYFLPGDYTYVKDSMEAWWNPKGISPNSSSGSTQGCWQVVAQGKRFVPEGWKSAIGAGIGNRGKSTPDGNEKDTQRDPCTGYASDQTIRGGTPSAPGT